jgi:hypothetical protein
MRWRRKHHAYACRQFRPRNKRLVGRRCRLSRRSFLPTMQCLWITSAQFFSQIALKTQADRIGAKNREESCLLPQIPLASCLPITQRHAARRSAGCCFIHSASCGAPIRQDCIETSAKSEVVTICSRQFAGDERLQSTAMILITTGEPRRYGGHWRR